MSFLPPMEFIDDERRDLWQSWVDANEGASGSDILAYAERLARMLQLEMSNNKTLIEAYETWHIKADHENMSDASAKMAEHCLIRTWKYGAELKLALDDYRKM